MPFQFDRKVTIMFSLTNLIEKKREQLFYLSKLYGLTHPQTIQCSQQLDKLINISMKKQSTKIKLHTNV